MLTHSLVHLGGYSWCLFPWLGTRSFRTLRKYIKKNAAANGISGIEFEGCYYITFKMEKVNDIDFIARLLDGVEREGIICEHLVENSEIPVFEKYDNYIPHDLLRKAYAADKLRADEAEETIRAIFEEFE
jgi:ATP-dependent Lhr-like helicase